MLQHIRLLIFDLDYVVFDCSALKLRALRQSLMPFSDQIPQNLRLPDETDAGEAFREYGFRWLQFLEIGLDEETLSQFQGAYAVQEKRLIEAGVGRIFPGLQEFFDSCRRRDVMLALGAEARRDYLLAVSDRHGMDGLFDVSLCTEEFGVGSAGEMLEEIMHHAGVNPSETLVLGTRSAYFDAAHALDVMTIGCGWGLRHPQDSAGADLEALTVSHVCAAVEQADQLATDYLP